MNRLWIAVFLYFISMLLFGVWGRNFSITKSLVGAFVAAVFYGVFLFLFMKIYDKRKNKKE